MKKSHIKKILKLEKMLRNELQDVYVESMLEMFPTIDYRHMTLPKKNDMVESVKLKLFSRHEELQNSKIVNIAVIKFVYEKYEGLRYGHRTL